MCNFICRLIHYESASSSAMPHWDGVNVVIRKQLSGAVAMMKVWLFSSFCLLYAMLCEGYGGAVARVGLKIISVAVQQRQSSDWNMKPLQGRSQEKQVLFITEDEDMRKLEWEMAAPYSAYIHTYICICTNWSNVYFLWDFLCSVAKYKRTHSCIVGMWLNMNTLYGLNR